MSVQNRTSGISGTGYLSDDNRNEDGLLVVHGIALGNNDMTIGAKSGERKLWRPDVLKESAQFLEGKDIVVNHENQDAYKKVGEVTDARYDENKGVIYQGVVRDEDLEDKIELGWLDVSPKLLHSEEFDEVGGVKAPNSIHDFPNLSIVRKGASPSNELHAGEHPELSVEELQASFEEDEGVQEYHFRSEEEELQSPPDDVDFARWMFDDREAAEGAAEAFPCDGTHRRTIEGEEWFMPCSSHDKFLDAIEDMDEDEMGEEEELSQSEKKRLAGQISSWALLTRDEALELLNTLDPSSPDSIASLVMTIERVFDDVEEADVEEVFDILDIGDDDMTDEGPFTISLSEELEEVDLDRREIGAALGNIWDVSTGEALDFMNALNPEEPSDRNAIAVVVSREYEGLDVSDVQTVLADAEEQAVEAGSNKEKYEGKNKDKYEKEEYSQLSSIIG